MNLYFSLVCFFAPVWAWLAFQCSVWSFILTHSPMRVYYIRKIMFYGAIDMTTQTMRNARKNCHRLSYRSFARGRNNAPVQKRLHRPALSL